MARPDPLTTYFLPGTQAQSAAAPVATVAGPAPAPPLQPPSDAEWAIIGVTGAVVVGGVIALCRANAAMLNAGDPFVHHTMQSILLLSKNMSQGNPPKVRKPE